MVMHKELENDFKRLADSGGLFHAYLFFGRKGVGKGSFARALASYVETGVFNEPEKDLRETMIVNRERASEDEEEMKESLGIDLVREAERFLYQKPVFSKYRCIIIEDAGWLTPIAQNALLKVLEEPPSHGLILATVDNTTMLLPTVLSRFATIHIGRVSDNQILDFLNKYGKISNEKVAHIVAMANGRIGAVRHMLEENDHRARVEALADRAMSGKIAYSRAIERIADDVLALFQEFPEAVDIFLEALEMRARVNVEQNVTALNAIANTIFFLRTLRLNKRIHLINTLWTINSSSRH